MKKYAAITLVTVFWLGLSSMAGAQPYATTEARLSYQSEDGLEIPAVMVSPKVAGAYPGVVYVHGRWGVSEEVVTQLHRLAERGFIVFAPEYSFARAVPVLANFNDLDSTRDIEAGVLFFKGFLKKKSPRSPAKVAILGQDHGGYHALMTSMKLVSEVSAFVGIYPLLQNPNENKINQIYSFVAEGIQGLKAPVLLLVGKEDREMRRIQIGRAKDRLTAIKHPVTLIEYVGAGRCFDWRINSPAQGDRLARQDMINQISRFVKTHTGGTGQLALGEKGWERI